jgi:hypothetical protein
LNLSIKRAKDASALILGVTCLFAAIYVFADEISFVDSGQNLGDGRTFSIALGDIDGDNDLDASKIYLNHGSGSFGDSGQSLGQSGQKIVLFDVEGNGTGGNKLYFNESAVPMRPASWGRLKTRFDRN